MKKLINVNVTLKPEQIQWMADRSINRSSFVRRLIDKEMAKKE